MYYARAVCPKYSWVIDAICLRYEAYGWEEIEPEELDDNRIQLNFQSSVFLPEPSITDILRKQ